MKTSTVDKVKPCKPISSTIKILESLGFEIIEQKLADHHFSELYFLMSGDLSKISEKTFVGMHQVKNNLICDCHWSTIELRKK